MKQSFILTAILFVACSISVAAQESRWSLKPNGGITVATLSGDEVECHFALYNLLKDDKAKHIPWSEMPLTNIFHTRYLAIRNKRCTFADGLRT